MSTRLMNLPMVDGSRHFAGVPHCVPGPQLRRHLERLTGARISGFAAGESQEVWIDFQFRGFDFSVHDHDGEYWFFVDDPGCPEAVLQRVIRHVDALVSLR